MLNEQRQGGPCSAKFDLGIVKGKGKSPNSIIYRFCWRGYIYCTWQARNSSLFQNTSISPHGAVARIRSSVRLRMSSISNLRNRLATSVYARRLELNRFARCGIFVQSTHFVRPSYIDWKAGLM